MENQEIVSTLSILSIFRFLFSIAPKPFSVALRIKKIYN